MSIENQPKKPIKFGSQWPLDYLHDYGYIASLTALWEGGHTFIAKIQN